MIAPKPLFNPPPTPGTPLRRLRHQHGTRLLLCPFQPRIRPVIVLPTRLLLMPRHIVRYAVAVFTCVAAEARDVRGVHLPGCTAFVEAPAEVGDGFEGGALAVGVVSVRLVGGVLEQFRGEGERVEKKVG